LLHVERGAVPCPTAVAFRRLKRAIEAAQPGTRVRPSTELARLAERGPAHQWWRAAGADMKLPNLRLTRLSGRMLLSVFATPLVLLPVFGTRSLLLWLVLVPLAAILAPRLPVTPPSTTEQLVIWPASRPP
jgi:hypothetical protein